MNFNKGLIIHRKLKKELGHDLKISVSLEDDGAIIAVSVAESKTFAFKEGKKLRFCTIKSAEFNRDIDAVITEIALLFKGILIDKADEEVIDGLT